MDAHRLYVGFFLAALANYFLGARYGWRVMLRDWRAACFACRLYSLRSDGFGAVAERSWRMKWSVSHPLKILFSREYRWRTLLNAVYVLVSIIRLWAGSVYVPAAISEMAAREKVPAAQTARLISLGTMLLSVTTILGSYCSAIYSGTHRAPGDARLFCVHDDIDRYWVRVCVLSRAPRAKVCFVSLFFWDGEALISRCIRYGCRNNIQPNAGGARLRLPLRWEDSLVPDLRSGGRRRRPFPHDRNSRGADFSGVSVRNAGAAIWA